MAKTTQKQVRQAYLNFDDDPLVVIAQPVVRESPSFASSGRRRYDRNQLRVAVTADNRLQEFKNGSSVSTEEDSLWRRAFYGRQQITYPQKEKRDYYTKGDILYITELDLHQFKTIFPLEFSSESNGFMEFIFWALDIKRAIRVGWMISDIRVTDPVNFDGSITFVRVMFVKDDKGESIPYPILTAEKIGFSRFQLHEQFSWWDLAGNMASLGEIIAMWESINITILSWYFGGVTAALRKKAGSYILKKVSKKIGEKLALKLFAMIAEGFVKSFVSELVKGLTSRFSARELNTMIVQNGLIANPDLVTPAAITNRQMMLNESNRQIIAQVISEALIKTTLGKLTALTNEGWGKGIVQFVGEAKWKQYTAEVANWIVKEIGGLAVSSFGKILALVIKSATGGNAFDNRQLQKALEEVYTPLLSPTQWANRFVKWGTQKIDGLITTLD